MWDNVELQLDEHFKYRGNAAHPDGSFQPFLFASTNFSSDKSDKLIHVLCYSLCNNVSIQCS